MRIALVLALLAFGCESGAAGTAADATIGADAAGDRAADGTGDDAPAVQPDAPPDQPDASPDAGPDAAPDVKLDASGDAGPFACGSAGLTCAANQYCVPQCCGGCGVIPDGGPCPTGATTCTLGGGATGCMFCAPAMCTNTIGLGCTLGGGADPRWLYCWCN